MSYSAPILHDTPPPPTEKPAFKPRWLRRIQNRYAPTVVQQIRGSQFWLKNSAETIGQFRIYEVQDIFPKTGKINVRRIYATREEANRGYTPIYTLTAQEFDAHFEPFTNQVSLGMDENQLVSSLGPQQSDTGAEVADHLEAEFRVGDDLAPSGDAVEAVDNQPLPTPDTLLAVDDPQPVAIEQ